jgi:hypothetical protein
VGGRLWQPYLEGKVPSLEVGVRLRLKKNTPVDVCERGC